MDEIIPKIETWDEVAETYEIEISNEEKSLAEDIYKIIIELDLKKEAKLIEIGCGSGHLSAILAQKGYDVTLLDFSEVALEKSKECFKNLKLQGKFINANLFELHNIIRGNYDLVWNSGVMEHFDDENLEKALRSIINIRSKYYLFSVPNAEALPYLLMRYKSVSTGDWIWGKEFLRTDYENFIKNIGYELYRTYYIGEAFVEQQLKYVLQGCISNFPVRKMMNDRTISKNQSYLKTYVFGKSKKYMNIDLASKNDEKSICTDYKTEIFDLMGEVNKYNILYNLEEKKYKELIGQNENYKYKKVLENIEKRLISAAHTNPFKLAYFMRRFKFEFVKGDFKNKKEFFEWFIGKFFRGKFKSKYKYNLLMDTAMEISEYANYINRELQNKSAKIKEIENMSRLLKNTPLYK